jgi:hypothetical protein
MCTGDDRRLVGAIQRLDRPLASFAAYATSFPSRDMLYVTIGVSGKTLSTLPLATSQTHSSCPFVAPFAIRK